MAVIVLLYSVDEASLALGLSRSRLYELIRSKQLLTVTQGRRRLIPVTSVEAFVEALKAAA